MHLAATWNQAQAVSFLSALEVEQQLRLEFVDTFCLKTYVPLLRWLFTALNWSVEGFFQTTVITPQPKELCRRRANYYGGS